jgi:hypothetical protein
VEEGLGFRGLGEIDAYGGVLQGRGSLPKLDEASDGWGPPVSGGKERATYHFGRRR